MKKFIFKLSTVATVLGVLFITQSAYSMDSLDEANLSSSMTNLSLDTKADDPSVEEKNKPSLEGKTIKFEVLKNSPCTQTLLTLPKIEKQLILQFCPYKDVYLVNKELHELATHFSIIRFPVKSSIPISEETLLGFAGNPSIVLMPSNISNESLMKFSNLHTIELTKHHTITEEGLKNLLNLSSLSLRFYNSICADAVALHTGLETLRCNDQMTDDVLLSLTGLTNLSLGNSQIKGPGLLFLTKLTSLNFEGNVEVTHNYITHLTNLERLLFSYNNNITASLLKLPKLEVLDLRNTTGVVNDDLPDLPKLTRLRGSYENITDQAEVALNARKVTLQWLN